MVKAHLRPQPRAVLAIESREAAFGPWRWTGAGSRRHKSKRSLSERGLTPAMLLRGTARVAEARAHAAPDLAMPGFQQERKRKEAERQAAASEKGEEHPAATAPSEAAQPPAAAPTAILRRPAEPRTLAAVAAVNADPPSPAEVLRTRVVKTRGRHLALGSPKALLCSVLACVRRLRRCV